MSPKKSAIYLAIMVIVAAVFFLSPFCGKVSAQCPWINCLSITRMLDDPRDYRWLGDWDPRFDRDYQTHYYGVNLCDCSITCDLQLKRQTCGQTCGIR
jgi:hypothetical protein